MRSKANPYETGGQQGGESGHWLRSVLAVLNRLLPGLSRQSEWVWFKWRWRLGLFQTIVVWLGFIIPMIILLVVLQFFGLFSLLSIIGNYSCQPGWGGYSLGGQIWVASSAAFTLLFMVYGAHLLALGRRIRKQQCTIQPGERPWVPTLLLEGEAALRQGGTVMFMSAMMFLVSAVMLYVTVFPFLYGSQSRHVFFRPAEMAKCQLSHSPKALPL